MPSIGKVEKKARRSPGSLTFKEACDLAEYIFGLPRKGSGSHVAIYKMDWQGDPRVNLQKGDGGKAKSYHVIQLVKLIDNKTKREDLS